jgi:hypothetical protein
VYLSFFLFARSCCLALYFSTREVTATPYTKLLASAPPTTE